MGKQSKVKGQKTKRRCVSAESSADISSNKRSKPEGSTPKQPTKMADTTKQKTSEMLFSTGKQPKVVGGKPSFKVIRKPRRSGAK